MASILDWDADTRIQVTWDSTPGLKREANRLKTVLSKNVYAELLAKIDKANKDLREFTHQNRYLEAVRNKRRVGVHRQRIADFRKIRRSARSLHNVVIGRKSWNCHHPHMVNIRLEPQPWDAAGVDGNKLKFRILLSCMHQAGNVPGAIPVWKWQELEIEPAEAQDVSSNPTTGLLFMSNSQTSQGHNAPSSDIKGSPKSLAANTVKKGVRFAIDNPSTNVPVPISIATLAAPITDMCSAVHSTPCSIRTCIGFLLDDHASSIAHRHDVFVLGDGKSADAQPQSLEKLLASWKQIGRRRPPGTIFFSRRDRIFIAASLASSVLQLDGSWLKKHWRSCDIFFLPKAGSNPDAVHHPYLSWDVPQKDNLDALTSSDPHSPFAVHLIHGEVFFPLGLTLVELSLGQTWADLEKAEEMDSKETMKNLKTALNYVYDESGPRYGDVVRRCLFWPIDFREPTLEDDEFQQSVLETIVMPLIEDWKDFDGSLRIR